MVVYNYELNHEQVQSLYYETSLPRQPVAMKFITDCLSVPDVQNTTEQPSLVAPPPLPPLNPPLPWAAGVLYHALTERNANSYPEYNGTATEAVCAKDAFTLKGNASAPPAFSVWYSQHPATRMRVMNIVTATTHTSGRC